MADPLCRNCGKTVGRHAAGDVPRCIGRDGRFLGINEFRFEPDEPQRCTCEHNSIGKIDLLDPSCPTHGPNRPEPAKVPPPCTHVCDVLKCPVKGVAHWCGLPQGHAEPHDHPCEIGLPAKYPAAQRFDVRPCKHCGKPMAEHYSGRSDYACAKAFCYEPVAAPEPAKEAGQDRILGQLGMRAIRAEESGAAVAAEIASWDAPPPSEEPKAEGDGWTDERCARMLGLWRTRLEHEGNVGGYGACAEYLEAIKRRNARIRELEAKLRVSLEQNDALGHANVIMVERDRLRAKCSRQRKELRRLNRERNAALAFECFNRKRRKEAESELAELRGREER